MFNYLANPDRFMRFSKIATPIFAVLAVAILGYGSVWSLAYAPADYLQGQSARIMFVHVPAAWVAFSAYSVMAGGSLVYLVWRHNLADVAANAASGIGATFTAVCLLSGSIWGRPT
ncbi:MAG: cytochrome c biogenesis protein CcsA, partial [Pseudomonadota bacterium]